MRTEVFPRAFIKSYRGYIAAPNSLMEVRNIRKTNNRMAISIGRSSVNQVDQAIFQTADGEPVNDVDDKRRVFALCARESARRPRIIHKTDDLHFEKIDNRQMDIAGNLFLPFARLVLYPFPAYLRSGVQSTSTLPNNAFTIPKKAAILTM